MPADPSPQPTPTPIPPALSVERLGGAFLLWPEGADHYVAVVEIGASLPEAEALAWARRLAAAPAMLAALHEAVRLIDVAVPQFDWSRSALSAEAIRILNEAPRTIRAAIAAAEGQA